MTPNWKDAPEWAKWLAQNADGSWFWHEETPEPPMPDQPQRWWSKGKMSKAVGGWRESAQRRP